MSSYSSDRRTSDTDTRTARVERRRAKRRLAQMFMGAAVVVAGLQIVGRSAATPQSVAEIPSLDVPPLWRPAADVLERSVGVGPWRTQAASLAGFDQSTRELLEWNTVFTYARKYRVTMELAELIHDTAVEEGIEPDLAFRLVRLESRFDADVVSHAGAIGLTQLMLGTARYFQPGVTAEQLTDPKVNLRIGFRYLRGLVRDYRGDLKIALLVYNRGPTAVENALAMGEDPANGYERLLMRGYTGSGVIN